MTDPMSPKAAERELRAVVERMRLEVGEAALPTLLAEYNRRDAELDRLRAALADRIAPRALLPMDRDGAVEAASVALAPLLDDMEDDDEELAGAAADAVVRYLSSLPYPVVLGPQRKEQAR